jgi:hypothetical protein
VVENRPVSEARPVYGYVLLGAGVVGIATGAVTGIMALSRANTVKDRCGPNYTTCDSTSVDAAQEGKMFSTVSTIGFAAGAVLTGVGLYFLIAAPTSHAKTAIRVTPDGAALTGTF